MVLKVERNVVKILLVILLLLSVFGSIKVLVYDAFDSKKIIPLILFTILLIAFCRYISLKVDYKYRKVIFILVGTVMICYQLIIVASLSGTAYWDVGTLLNRSIGEQITPVNYFSYYPNNIAIVVTESIIYHLSFTPSLATFTLILGIFNIILLDVGVGFIYLTAKKIGGQIVANISLILSFFIILITPYVALFYTDLFGFFLSSLLLYVLFLPVNWKSVLLIGVLGAFAYFIKPSLVITIIAYVLMQMIKMITDKNFKSLSKNLLVTLLVMGGLVLGGNRIISTTIDTSKTFDAWHFIAMGMNPNGGFYAPDVINIWNIKSPQERKEYSQKLIKQRLTNYGMSGYSRFLLNKQINNTADATFGWKMEGGDGFLIPLQQPNDIYLKIRDVFLYSASKRNWLGFVGPTQFMWTIALIGVLASLFIKNSKLDLIHLTILGFMIYLLLFEGGRSRYVIQFLPFILVAGASGVEFLMTKLRLLKLRVCSF